MALTAAVKEELSRLDVKKSSVRKAEVSAMLRFAGGLHIISGRIVIEAEVDLASTARRLRSAIAEVYGHASDIIVVSSGAVSAGMAPIGLKTRPTELAVKQAAATVGQVHLAAEWGRSFARFHRTIGQVLLTASDAGRRDRTRNAQRTLEKLIQLRIIPIVNENDTVATSEMRFGDNDRLAAIVAALTGADALYLLSDVDGLYDGEPRKGGAHFIPEVTSPEDLDGVVAGSGGALGTGGMASKLSAARLAADSGVPVLLAAASDAARALTTADVGTAFSARPDRLSARLFWVRHAADTQRHIKSHRACWYVINIQG